MSRHIRSPSHNSRWPLCDRQMGSETLTAEISVQPVHPAPVTNDRARVWAEEEIRGVRERADRTADGLNVTGAKEEGRWLVSSWCPVSIMPRCLGSRPGWKGLLTATGNAEETQAWGERRRGHRGQGVREAPLGQGSKGPVPAVGSVGWTLGSEVHDGNRNLGANGREKL